MLTPLKNMNELKRRHSWTILNHCSDICLEKVKKPIKHTKTIIQPRFKPALHMLVVLQITTYLLYLPKILTTEQTIQFAKDFHISTPTTYEIGILV
jgi:hypothetical protein